MAKDGKCDQENGEDVLYLCGRRLVGEEARLMRAVADRPTLEQALYYRDRSRELEQRLRDLGEEV